MPLLLDVTRRVLLPELMDDPQLAPGRHVQALRGLARINAWSGSARLLWREIQSELRPAPAEPLRILDVACGAGDVAIRLWRKAQRAAARVAIAGCDMSATAVAFARQRAAEAGASIDFQQSDAVHGNLPVGYDVITCSLFLHHLDGEEAVSLLRRAASAARRLVVVSDLDRTRRGYALAWLGTRLLTRSPVVHVDGPRSVQRAFTPPEALATAAQAGLTGATLRRRWPSRWVLRWKRP